MKEKEEEIPKKNEIKQEVSNKSKKTDMCQLIYYDFSIK